MRNMTSSHAFLRILLAVIATLTGVGGVLLLFAPSWGTQIMAALFGGGASLLERVLLMSFAALALAFSYLLLAAARDPERNVAIIDATAGLGVSGAMVVHLGGARLAPLIWRGPAIRLAMAVALIALRPRGQIRG